MKARVGLLSAGMAVILCAAGQPARAVDTDAIQGYTVDAPPIISWMQQRNHGIVMQSLDYSCGAASLATVLSTFYQQPTTELQILQRIGKKTYDLANFSDLARVAGESGYKGVGVALTEQQLVHLKIPAIVHLRYRGRDHFSVFQQVGPDGRVVLSDPAWGRRVLRRDQFKSIWLVHSDHPQHGRVLLVVPKGGSAPNTGLFPLPAGIVAGYDLLSFKNRIHALVGSK